MTPQQIDAMKLALEALEDLGMKHFENTGEVLYQETFNAFKEALREHAMRETQRLGQEIEQEPLAWLLTDKNINSLQVDSIQRLIDRLKHAHHTDLRVRINGQDEWVQADWLKHMVRATPPQRKPLTDEQIFACENSVPDEIVSDRDWCIHFARAIEAKIKENT